jgi:hypothetical protein
VVFEPVLAIVLLDQHGDLTDDGIDEQLRVHEKVALAWQSARAAVDDQRVIHDFFASPARRAHRPAPPSRVIPAKAPG